VGDLPVGGSDLNPLVVLGATGSIGQQTLEVAERIGAPVHAVAARRASPEILDIARRFPEAIVCIVDRGVGRTRLEMEVGDRLHTGVETITGIAATEGATVVNGIVGAAGLAPSLAALRAGNRLALANKESLVAGGELIDRARSSGGGELIPIDSEHSAIWQCLVGEPERSLARIVLTASGGPFRGRAPDELSDVTVDEALDHPTWSMGPRITVDSATMMNKAFEVIEAHHLFGLPYDDIDVVVHPQSFVHSFVEFTDGVVKAEVGEPDMRKPIQYAITAPARVDTEHPPFAPAGLTLEFEAPDPAAFPCLELGYTAGKAGGTAPAVLNAADEVAVQAFLDRRIAFTDIARVVAEVLDAHDTRSPEGIADVEAADAWARRSARDLVGSRC
jgi:1-deoxy-D-xylulose-5-phosphate reductoisomerase